MGVNAKRKGKCEPRLTDDEEALSTEEAAPYVGNTAATMREWRHLGKGPVYYRNPDGSIFYKRSDLDAFKATRKPQRIVPGEKRDAA
jgi:hypothetical protein